MKNSNSQSNSMKNKIVNFFTEHRAPKWFVLTAVLSYFTALLGQLGAYEGYVVATGCFALLIGVVALCSAGAEFM